MMKYNFIRICLVFLCYSLYSSAFAADSISSLKTLETKYKCKPLSKGNLSEQDKNFKISMQSDSYIISWCSKNINEDSPGYNLLISVTDKNHDWATCPQFIPLPEGSTLMPIFGEKKPATLYGKITTLKEYTYEHPIIDEFESKTHNGPGTVQSTGSGLYLGWEDGGLVLYCYNGKWLMSMQH